MTPATEIRGRCHCGNLQLRLDWPGDSASIVARACGCDFCLQHGARWISRPDARLSVEVREPDLLSKYRFGTGTADFYVCARCGAVPIAASAIDARTYAVVNANTLDAPLRAPTAGTTTSFEGEAAGARLDRRKSSWIADVQIGCEQPAAAPRPR